MSSGALGTIAGALGRRLRTHKAEFALGLRSTIAALITFSIGNLLGLPLLTWAVLTAVIVMQASVGASLKATLDRFAGTLGGAFWGGVVVWACPDGGSWSQGIALAVAVAPLAVLAAFSPALRMAPVTAIIVFGSVGQATGPLTFAIDRVLDVVLGSIVALAVAVLVLPARAHGLLAESVASALDLMADEIVLVLARLDAAPDQEVTQSSSDRIRVAVARVEAMAEESARERANRLADTPDPEPLVRTVRRVRQDLVMVGLTMVEPVPGAPGRRLAMPAACAATEIAAFLRAAGHALTTRGPLASLDGIERALGDYADAMAELRREGLIRDLPGDAAGRIFGLAFALDQVRRNLEDLADRVGEWTLPRRAQPAAKAKGEARALAQTRR